MSASGPKEASRRKELITEFCSKNGQEFIKHGKGQGDTRKRMVCSENSGMSG